MVSGIGLIDSTGGAGMDWSAMLVWNSVFLDAAWLEPDAKRGCEWNISYPKWLFCVHDDPHYVSWLSFGLATSGIGNFSGCLQPFGVGTSIW